MQKHLNRGLLALAATALALLAPTAPIAAGDVPTPDLGPEADTLRTLSRALEPLGNLAGLPGGCPTEGEGAVVLAEVFAAAGIPADESFASDAWGRPVRFWCAGGAWAAVSFGADGVPGAPDAALPDVETAGDDLMLFGDGRMVVPLELAKRIDRGRQLRTMADLRSIATVFEVYRVDHGGLPGAPSDGWQPVEALRALVQPIYIRELPVVDGWGHEFRFRVEDERYVVSSAGRDGTTSEDWWTATASGPVVGPDDDLVIADGEFVRWVD